MAELLNQPSDLPVWQQVAPLSQTGYKVDIDQGAEIRFTVDGMAVYMLKRQPGIYLNDHNKRVPDTIAAEAGFDTERWAKLRKRNEAKARANEAIDAEFVAMTGRRTVAQHEEYALVELSSGVFNIEFDGEVLNSRALIADMAYRRFEELTGVPAHADASQPADADVDKKAPKKA